ncbi:MAG: glycoside hydrolase family 16 protein [Pseudomonadota bacterium]
MARVVLVAFAAGIGLTGLGLTGLVSKGAAQESSPPIAETPEERVETSVPAGFELVWSDEFETPGLPDPTKWKYDTFRNKEGWFNNEKQYYAAERLENSRVEDGRLIIEARREDLASAGFSDWGGQEYSSARLITQGLGDWTYGFYEIRAKLPCGVGTWPAIWMLPSDPNVKWPAGGEIDIMEHVGFEPGVIHHSIHTTAFNFSRGTQKTSKHELTTACEKMHKYQLLWAPKLMMFAVDDQPKFLFQKESSKKARWPFDKPQHLLLNLAVGGTWGGQKGVDPAVFPARMEVDYVRVYQPKALTQPTTEGTSE